MRRFVALMAFCIALPARAADIDPATILGRLAAAPASTADFTETRHLSILQQPLLSHGTLAWQPPGHVEKTVTDPALSTMMADGDRLTLTEGGKTQAYSLASTPMVGGIVAAVTGTLSGDLPLLQRYYTVTATGTLAHWVLLLQPSGEDLRRALQYVRISGSGNRATRVETLEANGDSSDMEILPR